MLSPHDQIKIVKNTCRRKFARGHGIGFGEIFMNRRTAGNTGLFLFLEVGKDFSGVRESEQRSLSLACAVVRKPINANPGLIVNRGK